MTECSTSHPSIALQERADTVIFMSKDSEDAAEAVHLPLTTSLSVIVSK